MKRILSLLLALCALLVPSLSPAEEANLGVEMLAPVLREADSQAPAVTPLYCGPTQGAYRHGELSLDTSVPYVYFGQYDCWAMVALGTPENLGPVGWVETAALSMTDGPELSFEYGVSLMIEDDTFLTDEPDAEAPLHLLDLPRGAGVTLLARYGDWGYIQCELEDTFLRAFAPLSAML